MINDDPRRHMFNSDSPYHILNRHNTNMQNPLYVAAKHGHLDVVGFLVSAGADAKQRSVIEKSEDESILEVSVRWSHVGIVRYLLAKVDWKKSEIAQAFKHVQDDTDNAEIR